MFVNNQAAAVAATQAAGFQQQQAQQGAVARMPVAVQQGGGAGAFVGQSLEQHVAVSLALFARRRFHGYCIQYLINKKNKTYNVTIT